MKTRNKKGMALLLALTTTLTIALSGCGDAGDQTGAVNATEAAGTQTGEDGVSSITVGIPQDLEDSLDPHKSEAAGTREILFNVFEGLYKPDSTGNVVPAVASDCTKSEDGLTYTFTLRDGVKFHTGEMVTTEDVAASLTDCKENSTDTKYANIASVEATDDKTIVINLTEADPDFMSAIASVKAAITPANNEDMGSNPIGTGPYQYVSRSIQENIVMKKFDQYWGEPAEIEQLTFKVCADSDSISTSLNSGAIDMMAHLTAIQCDQLSEEFNVIEDTMNLVQGLYLNNSFEPFSHEEVRQALCYAVNKKEILDMVSGGKGVEIGSSMFPNFEKYYMPELNDTYTQDIEKAKKLLTSAGYADGFSFKITVPSNYTQHVDTAQVLVEQLKQIGVTAEINLVEWETWLSTVYNNRDYDATVVGVDASTLTASALLSRFTSEAGNNFINYSNQEYDKAYEAAITADDDATQTEHFKTCETILAETAANVYIQDLPEMVALNRKYTGYECYPMYIQDISKIRLAQ